MAAVKSDPRNGTPGPKNRPPASAKGAGGVSLDFPEGHKISATPVARIDLYRLF